jgi:hypothetical protein
VKRIFVGLTLLLLLFLPMTDNFLTLGALASKFGIPSIFAELFVAGATVAVFFKLSGIRERIIYPIPGIRLLTIGIVLYVVPLLIGSVYFVVLTKIFGATEQTPWLALVPAIIVGKYTAPILLLAETILLLGAFRLLTNLSSPTLADTSEC